MSNPIFLINPPQLPQDWRETFKSVTVERPVDSMHSSPYTPEKVLSYTYRDTTVFIEPGAVSNRHVPTLLNTVRALVDVARTRNPEFPTDFSVFVPKDDPDLDMDGNAGYCVTGCPVINLSPKVVNGAYEEFKPRRGHFMPVFKRIPEMLYILTHEYGHIVDDAFNHTTVPAPHGYMRKNSLKSMYFLNRLLPLASHYAHSSPQECYAEFFVQWFWNPRSVPSVIERQFGWGYSA